MVFCFGWFSMMTKHTSHAKRWLSLGSTVLLFAALGTNTSAQTTPATKPSLPTGRRRV